MGFGSALKKIKKTVKKATGFSSWSKARDAFLSPESLLTAGQWTVTERVPKVTQGWSDILGFSGVFSNDFDMPEYSEQELVGMQQTDSEGGSNVNRRRRASSYATAGGALGDSTYATSGVRNKLG